MTVKINKCFFIQSVIFKLPNVLKDLLFTSANFCLITTAVFFSNMPAYALSPMQPFILLF